MATRSAVFTFGLPEDTLADEIQIYSADSEGGSSTLDLTVSGYEYGTTTYEYDSLDDTKWYRLRFRNDSDGELGPFSDWVYGGNFDQASQFLAVSTGTDGANFATTQDVFDASSLNAQDVSTDRVSQALRRSRAIIDLRLAELDLDRLTKTFDTEASRRKHNATLRVVREAEVNIALGMVYRGLSDDIVVLRLRETLAGTDQDVDDFSIGPVSISQGNSASTTQLNALSNRYLEIGTALLESIQPPSIRLHKSDSPFKSPKFKLPFNGAS